MLNYKFKFVTFFLASISVFFIIQLAFNQAPRALAASLLDSQTGFGNNGGEIKAVYGEQKDLKTIVAQIINYVLSLLGIIFTIIVIIGGFKYMNAAGDEGEVKKALGQIKTGIIGLIIILSAYSITFFVIKKVIGATTGSMLN